MPEQGSVSLPRRDFLKLMAAGGIAMVFAPFVPWGNYMPNPRGDTLQKSKVIIPGGAHANVNTFPINHAEVITYPNTGDPVLDEEAFRKWQLIRLPEEFGGAANDVSAFRVYSNVCLHLWCLWKYYPEVGKKRGECPCHASTYDPVTGKAIGGPAALQAAPSNVLPRLDLEADSEGYLYILPPKFEASANGVVGYGRFLKS
jgi:Rieske Fe-S protein